MKFKDYVELFSGNELDEIVCSDKDIESAEFYFYKSMYFGKPDKKFPYLEKWNRMLIDNLEITGILPDRVIVNLYQLMEDKEIIKYAKEHIYEPQDYFYDEEISMMLFDQIRNNLTNGFEDDSKMFVEMFEHVGLSRQLNTYKIPFTYEVRGTAEVRAATLKEAIDKTTKEFNEGSSAPYLKETNIVKDSFKIKQDEIYDYNKDSYSKEDLFKSSGLQEWTPDEIKFFKEALKDYDALNKILKNAKESDFTLKRIGTLLKCHNSEFKNENTADNYFDVNYGCICATVKELKNKFYISGKLEIWADYTDGADCLGMYSCAEIKEIISAYEKEHPSLDNKIKKTRDVSEKGNMLKKQRESKQTEPEKGLL